MSASQSVSLAFPNQTTIQLPLHKASLGPDVIDIGLLGKQGFFTYDPGFMATAACESKITYIDGDQGILLHRGYAIDALAEQSNFCAIAYLLWHGELPTTQQYQRFIEQIKTHQQSLALADLFTGIPRHSHPMAMLVAVLGILAGSNTTPFNADDKSQREQFYSHLLATIPVIAAMCVRHANHQPFIKPDPQLDYAANFLYMLTGQAPEPVLAQALDRIFILHADHEQNASTSTVRLAGSTGTHPLASIAAGVAALWGPAHGGANEACLSMLEEIGEVSRIPHYVKRARDKDDPFRLMGFGHRVYKSYDPRAKVMRETCYQVLNVTHAKDEVLFKVAMELERIALEDEYFISKKLYPNVDFYSGITLRALGVPKNMFTVIFALARAAGWGAQWNEMMMDPQQKIGRPRQLYTGPIARNFPAES